MTFEEFKNLKPGDRIAHIRSGRIREIASIRKEADGIQTKTIRVFPIVAKSKYYKKEDKKEVIYDVSNRKIFTKV